MLLLISLPMAFAQSTNATVTGIVKDPNGNDVVGAGVELIDTATGVATMTKTNNDGLFRITGLLPGPYNVYSTSIRPPVSF